MFGAPARIFCITPPPLNSARCWHSWKASISRMHKQTRKLFELSSRAPCADRQSPRRIAALTLPNRQADSKLVTLGADARRWNILPDSTSLVSLAAAAPATPRWPIMRARRETSWVSAERLHLGERQRPCSAAIQYRRPKTTRSTDLFDPFFLLRMHFGLRVDTKKRLAANSGREAGASRHSPIKVLGRAKQSCALHAEPSTSGPRSHQASIRPRNSHLNHTLRVLSRRGGRWNSAVY